MSTDASENDAPAKRIPYDVPPEGSLGLLAVGYRGIEAWRSARGTDWIEERRQQVEAERAAAETTASETTAAETAAPEAPAASPAPAAEALEGVHVVVVSGLPRSGTSMLMQMLTAGGLPAFTDEAREADASNPRGYYEHERVKALARDQAWLPDADGHAVKVVAPLLPHLPPGPTYRVVLIERDLGEVLRSQTAMLERQGRPVADAAVLRNAYARHLARARAWIDRQPRADVLVLDHAAVIADPATAAERLAAFLDGFLPPATLEGQTMAAAVDPTLHRQRA